MSANTVVRTNVLSLNSHRNLGLVSNQQARASQRLSSGFRINSAADDAAGLGISEKMRAQIRGLDQASRNAQDGISLIQTAEGALDTVNEILIRVRELVVQAANDTNVGGTGAQSDRLRIQDEIDQLMDEIDAIAGRTEFNTRTLLDGSLSQEGTIRGGEWTTVDQVRTNAPSRIQTLDQFLRTTSNVAFEGSFEALLNRIGADLEAMGGSEWASIHGSNLQGLERAIDIAMGVDEDIAGTALANGAGRWAQLETARGLTFTSARNLLDSFVQGLHNPNALRPPGAVPAGAAQQRFTDWDDFMENGNAVVGGSTFARAQSTSGGMTIYQALINDGFAGLNPDSSFSDVRNVFYQMGGSNTDSGWAEGFHSDEIAGALTGWLATRFGDTVDTNMAEYHILNSRLVDLRSAQTTFNNAVSDARTAMNSQINAARATMNGAINTARGVMNAAITSARVTMNTEIAVARSYMERGIALAENTMNVAIQAARVRLDNAVASGDATAIASYSLALNNIQRIETGIFEARRDDLTVSFNQIQVRETGLFNTAQSNATSTFNIRSIEATGAFDVAQVNAQATFATTVNTAQSALNPFIYSVRTAQDDFDMLMAPERWNQFVSTYLTSDSEIVQRDVWVQNEAERERGVALWFQIGANSGQGINVEIGSMSTGTLFGRDGANHTQERRIIDVMDVFGYNVQDGADSNYGNVIGGNVVDTLLEAIDSALATTTRQRSALGAVQNRLEFSIENLDIASENLSAANSRIRDADMAREMMQLTQANVLQQAAISMLAQANQAPQSVLQLLG